MALSVIIEIQDALGSIQQFTLNEGRYLIGKSDTCDIVLNDSHVSRLHARLDISQNDLVLTDNNSTNGTWFQNQRILNPMLLEAGDTLKIGTWSLRIVSHREIPESSPPLTAPPSTSIASAAVNEQPESVSSEPTNTLSYPDQNVEDPFQLFEKKGSSEISEQHPSSSSTSGSIEEGVDIAVPNSQQELSYEVATEDSLIANSVLQDQPQGAVDVFPDVESQVQADSTSDNNGLSFADSLEIELRSGLEYQGDTENRASEPSPHPDEFLFPASDGIDFDPENGLTETPNYPDSLEQTVSSSTQAVEGSLPSVSALTAGSAHDDPVAAQPDESHVNTGSILETPNDVINQQLNRSLNETPVQHIVPPSASQTAKHLGDREQYGPAGRPGGEVPPGMDMSKIQQRAASLVEGLQFDASGPMNRETFQKQVLSAAQTLVHTELSRIDQHIRKRSANGQQPTRSVNLDLVSFGELEPLMLDPSVTQIMINGQSGVYIEQNGQLKKLDYTFQSTDVIERLIFKMIAPLGFEPSHLEAVINTTLPDGSQLNVVLPPVSSIGPVLTILKNQLYDFKEEHLIHYGSTSIEIMRFLQQCVLQKKNILITGPVGAGKTALLNVLTQHIPPEERVISVEEVSEIKVKQPHYISLQTGLARLQGNQKISLASLMQNALMMRPDRILIGEFPLEEAFNILIAMNSGNHGFISTFLSHSVQDLLHRLEMGVLMSKSDLPLYLVRDQIVNSVNIVVSVERFVDGSHKITGVYELVGLQEEQVCVQPVFLLKQNGVSPQGEIWSQFEATGYIPSFYRELEAAGETLDKSIFISPNMPIG